MDDGRTIGMGRDVMCQDLMIDGNPLASYGGKSLLDYTVGETELTNATFQGINRTNWNNLKSMFGMRSLRLTILFDGVDLHSAKVARSKFNAAVFGKHELYIPDDGFYYSVSCENLGEEVLVGIGDRNAQVKSEYTFQGIRHDALVSVTVPPNGYMNCISTMPFTDCRLILKSTWNATSLRLGDAYFSNVAVNDVLVFDGIDGKITKNGVNCAGTTTWTAFPSLVAGQNQIRSYLDPVTVEYYPTYI